MDNQLKSSETLSFETDRTLDTIAPTTDAESILRILASQKTTREQSPQEMIVRKLHTIERLLDVPSVTVCEVIDTDLRITYSQGVWERLLKVGMTFSLENTLTHHITHTDEPLVIADVANDARAAYLNDQSALSIATYLGVPVRNSDGTLYGTLTVIDARPRSFSDAQIALVQVLAGEIGYIIERENKLKSVLQAVEAADDDLGATLVVIDRQQTVLRIVAHDLRTPLSAIFTGSSALLQGLFGPIDPSKQRVVDLMDKASRYMNRLINDLMDTSVAENPMLVLVAEQFDAIEMGHELIEICEPRALEAGLTLNLEYDANDLPMPMVGDRERLMQALVNILSNAIVYTAVGSVTLRIRATADQIVFEVIDTGPGIAPEDLDRIWSPHVRATRKGQGLGLGLYVVSLLADRMGGERGVRSTVGEGSTFWFSLPRNGNRPQLASNSTLQ